MLRDRYDNQISTTSESARDNYIKGIDGLLGAVADSNKAFCNAIDADPDFVLAYCGLARIQQVTGDTTEARTTMEKARALVDNKTVRLSQREQAHVQAMSLLTNGNTAEAYPFIRSHVRQYPRDVMLAQTCTSVFGLIGFSGQPGREAEQLAYTESLLAHYGDDWWLLCQHAFALCETGQLDRANALIEKSLQINPNSAHSVHVRAHIYYESGDVDAGAQTLDEWMQHYNKAAILHCHLSWHVALWALEQGQTDKMWQVIENDVMPGGAYGPPLNVLTDSAAILYRAELAGASVPANYWRSLSDYASKYFPATGLAFADVHAALIHAMAGESETLESIVHNAKGPAADVVHDLAAGFNAIGKQDWGAATRHLIDGMSDHARIGGSRAQRDLIEFALANTLLRQGETAQAQRLLELRRPVQSVRNVVTSMR